MSARREGGSAKKSVKTPGTYKPCPDCGSTECGRGVSEDERNFRIMDCGCEAWVHEDGNLDECPYSYRYFLD